MTKGLTVEDLFVVRYGQSLELNRLDRATAPDGVNFVSRAMRNNGVTARVHVPDGVAVGEPGELTVALGGNGVLSTYIQPEPFVCGRDVAILQSRKAEMTTAEKLWWARCIKHNRYRHSYGRQANRTLKTLQLPEAPHFATPEGVRSVIDRLSHAVPSIPAATGTRGGSGLVPVSAVFDVRYGHSLELNRLARAARPHGVNFVARSTRNNGVTARVVAPAGTSLGDRGDITVALSGSPLMAFVQPEPFVTAYHVAILVPHDASMSMAERFWRAVCIRANRYRYSYGRQANRTLADVLIPGDVPVWVVARAEEFQAELRRSLEEAADVLG